MPYTVQEEKCTGCGACVDVCPVEAISLTDVAYINPEECIDCGACEAECPTGAIVEA